MGLKQKAEKPKWNTKKGKYSIHPEKEGEIIEQVGSKSNCLMVNINTNI